ncbi:unnamed protein product, partial [Mesorhabditis spiculigera]
MAIPCMVNTTIAVQNSSSSHLDNFEPTARCGRIVEDSAAAQEMGYQGTLDWSPSMRSPFFFSSTFYSSLVSVLFVGYLADRFGPKIMLLGASLDFLIMSYLAPSLASHSYWAFFGTRLVMGLAEGAVFPCLNSLAAKWFPPTEKSTMAAIYTSGIQISSAFSAPISAFLCTTSVGWPSIFYFFATAGLVWVILGLIFVTNSPSKNKFVSEREKKFLELHVGNNAKLAKNAKMPWKKLLFSKEVLATPEGLRPYAVLLFNLAFTDGVACFVGYFVMQ